jgi:hypothetical protein
MERGLEKAGVRFERDGLRCVDRVGESTSAFEDSDRAKVFSINLFQVPDS